MGQYAQSIPWLQEFCMYLELVLSQIKMNFSDVFFPQETLSWEVWGYLEPKCEYYYSTTDQQPIYYERKYTETSVHLKDYSVILEHRNSWKWATLQGKENFMLIV